MENNTGNTVYQIDKETGELIKKWESFSKASLFLGIDKSSIGKAVKGKAKTAGGFIWSLTFDGEVEETTEVLKEIVVKGTEDLSEESYKMLVRETIPETLLLEIYKELGCDCVLDAACRLIQGKIKMTRDAQKAMNSFYNEIFKERVKGTSCSTCLMRRLRRIKDYLIGKGLEEC